MENKRFLIAILSAVPLMGGFLISCATAGFARDPEAALRPAWAQYRKGNIAEAKSAAALLLNAKPTEDGGRYLLCLIAHMEGDYAQAIDQYKAIRPSYQKRKLLVSPIAWSYVFLGDYAGAVRHLESSGVRQEPALLEALRYWENHPLMTDASGMVELPFTEDRLSPFMPGFRVKLNGQEAVARLDTGGSYIHLTPAWAERLGVQSTGKEKGFASLREVGIGYGGFVDLELGSFILRNVPVYVMEHLAAQSEALSSEFGEELGPIIGTNVFQRFLTTIDGPGKRLVLSPRGDEAAAAAHAARIPSGSTEIPFSLWDDHFMIAKGSLGGNPVNLFFDSGLVAANSAQGQVALLASSSKLAAWGTANPEEKRFAVVSRVLSVCGMDGGYPTVLTVPEATWKGMGDWGGMDVDALISWGYLKNFAWTIDFDRRVFVFAAGLYERRPKTL
jgi:hypothetical protein